MTVSRRNFLKILTLSSVLGAGSRYFKLAAEGEAKAGKLTTVRSTCSPNCTGACAFEATVKDGRIVTLIQMADYPEKEYNPRGCLKGLSMLNLVYGPDRIKQPLIRVGKRGEGKFKMVSWDEALDYLSEKLLGIMKKYGPDSVAVSVQVPGTGYVHKGAFIRLASMFGFSVLHGYTMNGDLPAFFPMTFGVQTEEFESLEWMNSRYIAIFGSNIAVTRLPDAKFLSLARERGAKIITVDPNYTPTASKSDEWIPINPSTDAAFALGIVNVIINENLYDEKFIKTFTDMPLLVRTDTLKRLKASEVSGLKEITEQLKIPEYRDFFVVMDKDTKTLKLINPENLKQNLKVKVEKRGESDEEKTFEEVLLNPANPQLEGEFEVKLVNGKKVMVKTVFSMLKELVNAEYTPEKVAKIIAVSKDKVKDYEKLISRIAREMATTKPLHIVYGASNYQWYHGDLKGRALSLIAVLTGNIGKSGAGISTYAGQFKIRWPLGVWWLFHKRKPNWVTYLLWLNEEYRKSEEFKKYNRETPYPKNGVKAFLFGWNNPFDQHNMANRLFEMAESGELELIVAFDFQMTTSCAFADVVLPGVTWYEKEELTATILHPYVQLQRPAIKPLFKSMPEIWILKEIAKRLVNGWDDPYLKKHIESFYPDPELFRREERARKRGLWSLKLARKIANEASIKATKLMLKKGGKLVSGITYEKLLKGPLRLNLEAPGKRQIPYWEQINEYKPFPPVSFPVPLPKTARFLRSGRIEFYKEEDVFIDLNETLPVHKGPFVETEFKKNKNYKFAFVTRNSLYRVHSTHSNNMTLLELQNFKPKIFMNPEAAKKKGIKEGDKVMAYNDRGKVFGYAVLDPALHPDIVVFEQGWWNRYLDKTSYNTITYPWIKPTHLAYFVPGVWEPSTAWNEASCDVLKV